MGDVAECKATFNGQLSDGKARLEPDKLVFRGDFRVAIALKEITSLSAKAGSLAVGFPQGGLDLVLGPLAEKWLARIRSPKTLVSKLGIKPDSRLTVLGIEDEAFWQQVEQTGARVSKGRVGRDSDIIFLSVNTLKDTKRVNVLKNCLKKNGAFWLVYPKGKEHVKEAHIMQAGKDAGLVDIKVVSFSDTHTALKFVIPLSRR